MNNTTHLSIHAAGYCTNNERITLSETGQFKTIQFPSMFAVIRQHNDSTKNRSDRVILFDTGYTTEFYKATSHCPYCLYAHVTPVTVHANESASVQIQNKFNIEPQDVDYIIISHFHADHIGGLKHFPKAKFVCLRSGYEAIRKRTGFSAVSCGFLPDLLPKDFDDRVVLIDDEGSHQAWTYLYNTDILGYDLFGDSSLFITKLPGHHPGHCGALVHASDKSYLLIGDACWSTTAYKNNELPSLVTKYLVHDNWDMYKKTLSSIHQFHNSHPNVKIIPSHCQEIYQEYCEPSNSQQGNIQSKL